MLAPTLEDFTDTGNPEIRPRVHDVDQGIQVYLDGQLGKILTSRAVEHPFLNWYRNNPLTPAQERALYLEFFYFFRYLPFYIAGMALNTRDETILQELLFNVLDEMGGPITHPQLYRQFLHQLGISDEEIAAYTPLPTTTALNEGIRKLYTESPIEKALGALYADETMSAVMVGKINDGLENQGYDKAMRFFWVLHINVEMGHSNSVFNAIFPHAESEETKRLFEAGLAEFLRLLEAYWDGVEALVRNQ